MQAAAMDTLVQQLPECCRSSSFTVQCGCGERWRVEEQSSFPGYNMSLEQDYSKPLRMDSCCERDCNDDRGRRCPENLVSSIAQGQAGLCVQFVAGLASKYRAAGANALWSEPIRADIYLQNGKAWSKFLGTLAANVYVYIGILLLHGSSSRRYSYKLRLPKGLANECQVCLRCRCFLDVSHRKARG